MSDTTTSTGRKDFRFFHRLRVRWAEVDMQKIVFNAHYLMYFDTAIADYWRAMALPYEEAMLSLGGDLYVRKATVEFNASARVDGGRPRCWICTNTLQALVSECRFRSNAAHPEKYAAAVHPDGRRDDSVKKSQ